MYKKKIVQDPGPYRHTAAALHKKQPLFEVVFAIYFDTTVILRGPLLVCCTTNVLHLIFGGTACSCCHFSRWLLLFPYGLWMAAVYFPSWHPHTLRQPCVAKGNEHQRYQVGDWVPPRGQNGAASNTDHLQDGVLAKALGIRTCHLLPPPLNGLLGGKSWKQRVQGEKC